MSFLNLLRIAHSGDCRYNLALGLQKEPRPETQLSRLFSVYVLPSVHLMEQSRSPSTPNWEEALHGWINKASPEELTAREEVAQRIRACHLSGATDLHLDNTPITSLAGVIFPEGLTHLYLKNTQITSLEDVRFPEGLTELHLSYTPIDSLVGTRFPAGLKNLSLLNTPIDSLDGIIFPQGLRTLLINNTRISSLDSTRFPLGLTSLFLLNTQINSLHRVIFPEGLTNLILRNTQITSLPESLAQLPKLRYIETQNCRLNAAANEAFQSAINRFPKENPDEQLYWISSVYEETPQILSSLNLNSFHLPEDLNFNEDQKTLFNQFLKKVQGTQDYNHPLDRPILMSSLEKILEAASTSDDFKDHLFPLINEALDSCSDRTAITLNRIDLQRQLDCGGINPELLIGYRRLQLLHEAASKIIKEKRLGDAIEPMLYLQIKLKEALNLPIATNSMRYEGLAHITDDELEQIKQDILSKTSSPEQILSLFTEKQEKTYNDEGKVIALGDLSLTNPFLADISELWTQKLRAVFPVYFKRIEPKEDEDLTDKKVNTDWETRRQNCVKELTKELVLDPLRQADRLASFQELPMNEN